jgi:MFS family permease
MSGLLRGLGRNVIGLGFASFFTDLGAEMITPLIPVFLLQLGAPRAALGLIEGLGDAVASLLRIVSGWLSDRLGKRKVFVLAGYGVAAAMRPLMGLVAAAWQLGAIRIVDRIGKGVRLAPRDALIADSCDPSRRGRAFGFQRAMDNLGGVVGMLVAAALLRRWDGDLRSVFLLTAVPAACVLVVIAVVVRDTPPAAPPARLRLTLKPFGPEFRGFLATVGVFTLGNSSDLFLIPRLLGLGLGKEDVPLVWCAHTVVRMLAALPAGILADRLGKKRMVLAGWLVYAAAYAGLGFADSLLEGLVLLGLYGLYGSLAESVLRAIVADLVPAELRGTAYGMYYFVVGVAILPANLAFGAVWDEWGSGAAFGGSAALALLATGMLLRIRTRAA